MAELVKSVQQQQSVQMVEQVLRLLGLQARHFHEMILKVKNNAHLDKKIYSTYFHYYKDTLLKHQRMLAQ